MFRGFFWGLIAGTVIGLLFAPQRGDETRTQLQGRINTLQQEAQTKYGDLRSKSNELIEQGRQSVNSTLNRAQSSATSAVNSAADYAKDHTSEN